MVEIELRPLRREDINGNYLRWVNDPEVNRYMETGRFPMTMENLIDYYERMTSSEHDLIFAIWADCKHIGNITLNGINWIHRIAEVALMIGEKDYWNRGIGTEAIKLITKHAFEKLNLYKLTAGAYVPNKASRRAFAKAGWEEEGTLFAQYEWTDENGQRCRVGRVIMCRFGGLQISEIVGQYGAKPFGSHDDEN